MIAYSRIEWIQNKLLRWGFAHVLALGWLLLGSMVLLFLNVANVWTIALWLISSLFFAYPKIEFPKEKALSLYLLLIPYFALALIPPWYRDSLTYHLALPKIFTEAGGYTAGDEIIFGYFPLGWQSILSIPHFLGVDAHPLFNPRLITVWLSGALACSTVGLARELGATSRWSMLAGILLLLIPTQIEFGTSCYVQVWLTLLSTLSLAALYIQQPILVGICAGLAASSKYSGLFVCLIMTLLMRKQKEKGKFFIAMLLCASPFYLRNLILKGNPIFPLGYNVFGGDGWDLDRAQGYAQTLSNYGMGREFIDTLLLLPRVFFTQDMVYFFQGSLGPVIGLFFLLACLQGKKFPKALLYIGIWFVLWSSQVQQIRFLMPCIPIVLALGVSIWKKDNLRWMTLLVLGSLVWLSIPTQSIEDKINAKAKNLYDAPFLFLWKRQHTDAFLRGAMSKSDLLSRMLPNNYPIYQYLNNQPAQKVWLVWSRGYVYYLHQSFRLDSVFGAWRMELFLNQNTPKQALAELKEQKISHVLINMRFFLVDQNADHLGDGKTLELRSKFQALLDVGVLTELRKVGSVFLYQVSDSDFEINPQ